MVCAPPTPGLICLKLFNVGFVLLPCMVVFVMPKPGFRALILLETVFYNNFFAVKFVIII